MRVAMPDPKCGLGTNGDDEAAPPSESEAANRNRKIRDPSRRRHRAGAPAGRALVQRAYRITRTFRGGCGAAGFGGGGVVLPPVLRGCGYV